MASLAPVNGSSPAEQLRARHAANTSGDHHVLVEDAIDEDDIQHPPPPAPGPSKTAANTTAGASLRPKAAPLNVNSEEAFPSLGPSKAAAAPLQTWSRKPVVSANGNAAYGSSAASKGKAPTQHGAPLASRPAISSVSLPGRSVERISFAPHQITPRNQLKRTVPEILREINRKYKAKVEVREGTDGHVVFEGTGTQEAVRQALKEVANQLGSKVKHMFPRYLIRLTRYSNRSKFLSPSRSDLMLSVDKEQRYKVSASDLAQKSTFQSMMLRLERMMMTPQLTLLSKAMLLPQSLRGKIFRKSSMSVHRMPACG